MAGVECLELHQGTYGKDDLFSDLTARLLLDELEEECEFS